MPKPQQSKTKFVQRGFTLVEIAIVLVIIGLLIGGVLRGQELITSARVRTLVSQGTAFKTAYLAFLDRYRVIAGDMNATQATTVATAALPAVFPNTGIVEWSDGIIAQQNLAVAGFINCAACLTTSAAGGASTIGNSMVNAYSMPLFFQGTPGGNTGDTYLDPSSAFGAAHRSVLLTGAQIPFAVAAEIDRKADDGMPANGDFRFGVSWNAVMGGLTPPQMLASCIQVNAAAATTAYGYKWTVGSGGNCMGAWIIM
jgi:prepilin-type N-terminal cleavage/methylation domain-containing protein